MKKAIKIALTTMIILCMMLGAMHWFKSHQEEKRLIRQDQERIAQYILDNVELVDGQEIKKIKFLSFKKPNTTARIWSIDIEINDNIAMNLSENKLGDKLSIIYSDKEVKYISKERERRKIEIIYLKDGKHGR